MARRKTIGLWPILVLVFGGIWLLEAAHNYIEPLWNDLFKKDEFRVDEVKYWPTHPDAHPDYVVVREQALDLIPRVLYNHGITQIDGIPINSEKMTVTTPLVPGAWGKGRQTYDRWALIAEKSVPIYAVSDNVGNHNVVKNRFPKKWERCFLENCAPLDPVWLAFSVMMPDPKMWDDQVRLRSRSGPYTPAGSSGIRVTFAVKVAPVVSDESRLGIHEIIIRSRADSSHGIDVRFWNRYFERVVNSPYNVPVINDEVFHAVSRGNWAPGACERRRAKALCQTLVKNTRTFPNPGREIKDSF